MMVPFLLQMSANNHHIRLVSPIDPVEGGASGPEKFTRCSHTRAHDSLRGG